MKIPFGCDKEFDSLWDRLEKKYPQDIFELDGIGSQLDTCCFSKKFFTNNTTTADISIDSNANVSDKGVTAYSIEMGKPLEKLNSYYMMWKLAKKMFGVRTANHIVESAVNGDIYINDFYGFGAGKPYCFNYSCYDIATRGLPMVDKIKSLPPKYLYAFKSQVEQFVTVASNATLGATGLADLLLVMSFYVEDILERCGDAHFKFASEEDCWTYIRETIVSMIYTINQPMRANQCVTEDTEVLTPDGFKKYNELKVGENIYTWDNGKLNIQKVEKVNVYDYDGEMHQYSGRDTIQTVTPNHRVLFKKNNSKEYALKASSELFNAKTPLTYPVAMLEDDRPDYSISDDLLKLCVFVLTDGNINGGSRISIFKSPKRWGNEEIINTLNHLGMTFTTTELNGDFGELNSYNISTKDSKKVIELLDNTKQKLPDWFTKLSRRQANLVIDLWAKFYGHTESENYNKQKCQCDNYGIADQLQHICFLAGKGSKITSRKIGDNKQETIYLIPYHRVNKDARKKEIIQYKGKVWCPTTKDGVVVFRKDGMIFVSGNSPFTNISLFDDIFLRKLQSDYLHPTKATPLNLEIVRKLQELFIDIMNHELDRTPITFPVVSACFARDNNFVIKDENFLEMIADKNRKYGFLNIYIGKSSTLSSCCRLRSDLDNDYFNSFGAGSSKIGSLGVATINCARLGFKFKDDVESMKKEFKRLVSLCFMINYIKRTLISERIEGGYHSLYSYGFIDINRQYSTLGINGFNELICLSGYDPLSDDGVEFGLSIIKIANRLNNSLGRKYNVPVNIEQIPAENTSVKLADKDKVLGYNNGEYDFYSNQFIPLTVNADILDRMRLQGVYDEHFSGGSIFHANFENRIYDKERIKDMVKVCAKLGIVYFAFNYVLQRCERDHMTVGRKDTCECGAEITDNFTRVVGFLTSTKNWAKARRIGDFPNRQFYD